MFNTIERSTEESAFDIANVVAGVCLMLCPWAFGFTAEAAAAWSAWIAGAAIALVAIRALVAFTEWEEWANLALGVWTVVAPWAIGFAGITYAAMAQVAIGLIVALLAGVELWFIHDSPISAA